MTPTGVAATTPKVAVQREDRFQDMASEIDEFRSSLVAAVQAELERHASAVVAEVDRLRDEDKKARNALRSEMTEQLKALGAAIDQMNATIVPAAQTAQNFLGNMETTLGNARVTVGQTDGCDAPVAVGVGEAAAGFATVGVQDHFGAGFGRNGISGTPL